MNVLTPTCALRTSVTYTVKGSIDMVGGGNASCDDLKVSIASGSQELCPLQVILKIALAMSS